MLASVIDLSHTHSICNRLVVSAKSRFFSPDFITKQNPFYRLLHTNAKMLYVGTACPPFHRGGAALPGCVVPLQL